MGRNSQKCAIKKKKIFCFFQRLKIGRGIIHCAKWAGWKGSMTNPLCTITYNWCWSDLKSPAERLIYLPVFVYYNQAFFLFI